MLTNLRFEDALRLQAKLREQQKANSDLAALEEDRSIFENLGGIPNLPKPNAVGCGHEKHRRTLQKFGLAQSVDTSNCWKYRDESAAVALNLICWDCTLQRQDPRECQGINTVPNEISNKIA